MNIVMLSTDKNILDAQSAVAKRMCAYGELSERLTIVLLGVGDRTVVDLSKRVHVVFPGGTSKREAYKNAFWEGMREARALPASLVTTQDPFFVGFVGWRIARALHVPFQAQVHTDFLNSQYMFVSFRKFFEVLLSFFILSQATCIRVVSQRIARSLKFFGAAKIQVLPIHAPEHSTPTELPSEYKEGKRILMVSRLEEEKRVGNALRALSHVQNAHLYIVGDGSLRGKLERLAKKLHIQDRVHFLGWQKETSRYYAHADVFLQLSRFEGYGLSLIEAAHAGLPIVSTHVGVVGDIFVPGEDVIVTNGRETDVSRSLTYVFENTEEANNFGKRAKQKVIQHTTSYETYLDAYKRTLEQCAS